MYNDDKKDLEDSWFSDEVKTETQPENKKDKKSSTVSSKPKSSKRKYFDKTKKVVMTSLLWTGKQLQYVKAPFVAAQKQIKKKPILGKILYTLLLIITFRVATSITTPGVTVDSGFGKDPSSFVGIMDMMGGGALKNFSIVALGISPYITASIIMTLLQSEIFPPLYRLSKSGPAGKRKINVITRILTLVFSVIQAITIIQQLSGGSSALVHLKHPFNTSLYKYFALPILLMAGSLFTLFLGEQITKKGIGNGTSLIIFSGIAVNLPSKIKNAYNQLVTGSSSSFVGIMNMSIYILVFLVLIYIIGYLYKAERHVPIQQTGAGMTKEGNKISHLPIKLNPAGVMPVIFALSISILPVTIVQFMNHQNEGRIWIENNLKLTAPIGLSILIGLTFIFTIAMSIITFNPFNVAESFKKNGTFIPGIKPGEETEKYLTGVVIRLATFSAFYLSVVTSIQYIEQIIGLDKSMTLGGTSIIILVTVSIETISQLKARYKTNDITKARKASVGNEKATGGLLW